MSDIEKEVSPFLETANRDLATACRDEGRAARWRDQPRECAYTWPDLRDPWLAGWDEQDRKTKEKNDG